MTILESQRYVKLAGYSLLLFTCFDLFSPKNLCQIFNTSEIGSYPQCIPLDRHPRPLSQSPSHDHQPLPPLCCPLMKRERGRVVSQSLQLEVSH